MWSFVTGFFSGFIHVVCSIFQYFFLLRNTFSLYGYITSCLFIHWWLWVVWLLWIMLLWRFMYTFFCQHMFLFPLSRYAEMEPMSRMVTLCLTFWGTAKLFPKAAAPFYIPASNVWGSNCQQLFLSIFFSTAIWMGGKWYFIVVLICISLLTNDVEHLFMCTLAIWALRNAYSNPLPIFKLDLCL